MNNELKNFAKILVEEVRDRTISMFDIYKSNGAAADASSMRYKEKLGDKLDAALENIVPDVVDNTIFYLLSAIENGFLPLKYISEDGGEVVISEEANYELSGDYIGDDGYRESFSKQRFYQALP